MLAHKDVRRFELNADFCFPSVLTSLLVAASIVARPSPRNVAKYKKKGELYGAGCA
jgi:hypothetical protein